MHTPLPLQVSVLGCHLLLLLASFYFVSSELASSSFTLVVLFKSLKHIQDHTASHFYYPSVFYWVTTYFRFFVYFFRKNFYLRKKFSRSLYKKLGNIAMVTEKKQIFFLNLRKFHTINLFTARPLFKKLLFNRFKFTNLKCDYWRLPEV